MEEQKMKKKLLTASLLTLCAIALVVGSVLTTIALLTASSGVSNVFTVGKISIAMWESKVNSDGKLVDASGNLIVDANGNLLEGKTPVKVDTNSYHLVPGKTYVKDPTIYIQSGVLDANVIDNMYLFVKSSNLPRLETILIVQLTLRLCVSRWKNTVGLSSCEATTVRKSSGFMASVIPKPVKSLLLW